MEHSSLTPLVLSFSSIASGDRRSGSCVVDGLPADRSASSNYYENLGRLSESSASGAL